MTQEYAEVSSDLVRSVIEQFINERKATKLDGLKPEDPKRDEISEEYNFANWIESAANRVRQLQVVTHSLKAIHSDAKGSSVFLSGNEPSETAFVSSLTPTTLANDVVGNAAALDVYKMLCQPVGGTDLLSLALGNSKAFQNALSVDPKVAEKYALAFASITAPKDDSSSHVLAKQIYWPVSTDFCDDTSFEILAPLYPSSFVHSIYKTIDSHRFGEDAKKLRDARKAGIYLEGVIHDYPDLAVQIFGGSKPQNISQLNSQRGGKGLLLGSRPPIWDSLSVKPIFGKSSFFPVYAASPLVKETIKQLRRFIKKNPRAVMESRDTRHDFIEELVNSFISFSGQMRELTPGWSRDDKCKLDEAHKWWLDPDGMLEHYQEQGTDIPRGIPEQICDDFATWALKRLEQKDVLLGDPEFAEIYKLLKREIDTELREAIHGADN